MAAVREEPLDPEQVICDPHHHLWDNRGDRYLVDDLRADVDGHRVVATVFVECMAFYRAGGPEDLRPVGETETVARLAAETEEPAGPGSSPYPVIGGIVGFADLRSPRVDALLEAHVEAGGGRFRGVRHASAWDASPDIRAAHSNPPPGLLSDPSFRAGMAALARAGLSYDAWLYHPQLGELVDLARAHDDVPIVLDHLGAPLTIGPYAARGDDVRRDWRTGMTALATCPNVSVKVGGIGMPLMGLGWQRPGSRSRTASPKQPSSEDVAAAWGEDVRWCIETFGSARCMFESNFPVDKNTVDYTALWNAFMRMTSGASNEEKADLFHRTAARVYRLELPAATA
jgi:L-fuconolactonase